MKIMKSVFLTGLLLGFADAAWAQSVIVNRTALDVLLGSNRTDEAFEGYGLGGGAARGPGILTSTNVWGGLANPVVGGITFSSTHPSSDPGEFYIQWNGDGWDGGISQTIFSSGSLLLDFWNPTSAFGIDIKDTAVLRQTFVAGVRVYGTDKATLLYSDNAINLTDPTNGFFFGFQFTNGIGAVEFFTVSGADPYSQLPHVFSPKVDNFAFSTMAVPEPTTLSLAVIATATLLCVRRRR